MSFYPIQNCGASIADTRIMCAYHGRPVPPELTREVWRSRRIAARSDARTVSGRTAWEAWERARSRAIDAVRGMCA